MLRLCYKDYLASRWLWLSVAALYVLYIVQPMGQTILVMAFGMLAVYAALSVTMIFEDQSRTETLYASLPLDRKTIVRGRYLLVGIIVLGSAALIFGSAALVLALFKAPAYEKALSPLLSVEGVTGFLFAAVFFLAGFLPPYYRFGLGKGHIVYSGGMLALMLAFSALEWLASRVFHLISPVFTADFLKDPGIGFIGLIGSVRAFFGSTLYILLILGLLTLLVWISLRLSTRFYDRKEL